MNTNVIFMVTDKDGLPLLVRNTHDFNAGELPPQLAEVLLRLFTHPLYAMSHIAEKGDPEFFCCAIKNQSELDSLMELVKAEGVKRIHIDPCLIKNESHERIYALIDVNKIGGFQNLINILADAEGCLVCHDAQRIADEMGQDTMGKILKYA